MPITRRAAMHYSGGPRLSRRAAPETQAARDPERHGDVGRAGVEQEDDAQAVDLPGREIVSRPVLFEHHVIPATILAHPAAVHVRVHPAVGVLAFGQPVAEHEARDREDRDPGAGGHPHAEPACRLRRRRTRLRRARPGLIHRSTLMTARASTTWTPAPARATAPAGTNSARHTSASMARNWPGSRCRHGQRQRQRTSLIETGFPTSLINPRHGPSSPCRRGPGSRRDRGPGARCRRGQRPRRRRPAACKPLGGGRWRSSIAP